MRIDPSAQTAEELHLTFLELIWSSMCIQFKKCQWYLGLKDFILFLTY